MKFYIRYIAKSINMRLLLLVLAFVTSITVSAQVGIGVNFANVDPSAQLEVSSTNKGFLVPRMTSSQRTGISNPAAGLLVYQTDAPIGFYYFTQGKWKILGEQDITLKLNISDTATMLLGYARVQRMLDSLFAIQGRINQKLNLSDTGSMLSGYARVSRLLDSLSSVQLKLNLKLNSKDTVSLSARIESNKKGIIDSALAIRSALELTNLAIQLVDAKISKAIIDSGIATRSALSDTAGNIRLALLDSADDIRAALFDTASSLRSYADLKVNIADTSNMLDPYLRKADTSAMLSNRLKRDTASLSARIEVNKQAIIDTASNLRSYADLKVNIADTSNMLDPYLRKADTSLMLSNRFKRDTASLSARIEVNKQAIIDTASNLRSYADLKVNIADTSNMLDPYLRKADTSLMLSNRFKRDTASLSARIEVNKQAIIDTASNLRSYADLKVNIADTSNMLDPYLRKADTSLMLSNRFKRDTASLSARIEVNKQAIIDTASNLRSYADLKVNIADTSNMLDPYLRKADTSAMLSSRFERDTASLSARIEVNKQAIIDTASNLRSYADLKVNIADTSNMLDPYLRKADTSAMLSSRFERDTASLSARIEVNKQAIIDTASNLRSYADLKVNIADTSNMLDPYLRKADTSAMLSNRFKRDTASLSARINNNETAIIDTASSLRSYADLKVNIADTSSMLSAYLRKADTSAMLSNRFKRDTASLSARINNNETAIIDTASSLRSYADLKVNIADTSSMLSAYLRKIDTASLSRRIDSLRPVLSGDIVYGGIDGVPTRLEKGTNGQILQLTDGFPVWASNTGVTTVGPVSATATSTGAYIASNTLYLAPADVENAGIISTATQTFAGAKTFSADLTVNGITVGTGPGNDPSNTATGQGVLSSNTMGLYNTASGSQALFNNTEGLGNTATGVQSLFTNTTGFGNTAMGPLSLYSNKTGTANTVVGFYALANNTSGSYNTAIGTLANVADTSFENATAIGANAIVNASNTIQLGNNSIDSVVTAGKLILGSLTYPNTDSTAGLFLKTNGAGKISWASAATDTSSLSSRIDLKVNIADTSNMLDPYLRKIDTSAMLSNRFKRDTASLSNRIEVNIQAIIDTASNLRSYADLKVNIADTSNMLDPYLRKADTSAMLSNRFKRDTASLSSRIDSKFTASDTIRYVRKATTEISIGLSAAGATGVQGTQAVAIGNEAGNYVQGSDAVALGSMAGRTLQGSEAVAVGSEAGYNSQGSGAVALGVQAGRNTQGASAVAIGPYAGYTLQSGYSIAIGENAGTNRQGTTSVAIGYSAGDSRQSSNAVALGNNAGASLQGQDAIAIGTEAGKIGQGQYSIALGAKAGDFRQSSNSIILNASGNTLDAYNQGFYVSPIRDTTNPKILFYNPTSKEITYSTPTELTLGAVSDTSTSNGAIIASNTLYLAPADENNPGIVDTTTQTFAGSKTFKKDLTINGITIGTGGGNDPTNIVAGREALANNTSGSFNTASGYQSMLANINGNGNVATGPESLFSNTSGNGNTANGGTTLSSNTSGNYNTAVGFYTLTTNISGNYNTAIGTAANVSGTSLENATAIGANAIVNASNTIQLGNSAIDSVVTSGKLKLGNILYPNTDSTAGMVLTTDGSGTASWAMNTGITTVGPVSATATSTGAYIASNTLYLAPADVENAGIISTATQTFAGAKTFSADLTVNGITVGKGAGDISSNSAIGLDALKANTTGFRNTAMGSKVLFNNDEGIDNTAIGYQSLLSNLNGNGNTSIGVDAMLDNTTGSSNTAIGVIALNWNISGSGNTANGLAALLRNTSGGDNTAIGKRSLQNNRIGQENTAVGAFALQSNNTGSNNTAIGFNADVVSSELSNATAIGANAVVNSSNTIQLGNSAIDSVVTAGKLRLGNILYPNTDSTAGMVLTTDGSGTARWTSSGFDSTQFVKRYANPIAIGDSAAKTNQGSNAIALGSYAAKTNQGSNAIALGSYAANTNQGSNAIALGNSAGIENQDQNTIAVGSAAGSYNQGSNAVAIGTYAGYDQQKTHSVAIGTEAAYSENAPFAIAIGYRAGFRLQTQNAVAIGKEAGYWDQWDNAVSIGTGAGYIGQHENSVAIGNNAGNKYQWTNAIAIGNGAGAGAGIVDINDPSQEELGQAVNAIAIGTEAGNQNQEYNAIAFGASAGYLNQSSDAIAVGYQAGVSNQNTYAISIGSQAGYNGQKTNSIAIGQQAGAFNQGEYAIALGTNAGFSNQANQSIILNASSSSLNAATTGLFVNPIRSGTNSTGQYHLYYDASTKEIKYSITGITAVAYNEIKANSILTGNLTMTSDRRLKSDIKALPTSLDVIKKLNPVSYKKKDSLASTQYNHEEMGFIAQEIQKVLPMVVKEGTDKDKILSVNYISLIPVLTKAIQEQQTLIESEAKAKDEMKKQIENQQKQIDELKKMMQTLLDKK